MKKKVSKNEFEGIIFHLADNIELNVEVYIYKFILWITMRKESSAVEKNSSFALSINFSIGEESSCNAETKCKSAIP